MTFRAFDKAMKEIDTAVGKMQAAEGRKPAVAAHHEALSILLRELKKVCELQRAAGRDVSGVEKAATRALRRQLLSLSREAKSL